MLDGLKATTHWLAAQELARRHPAINVDPDVLYVDNGNVLTSAGAAAGFDLCLHLVRRDLGFEIAASVARAVVMPLERFARHAATSTRTLSTRFLEQVGTTPFRWIAGARVLRAQQLLETTSLSIEHVRAA